MAYTRSAANQNKRYLLLENTLAIMTVEIMAKYRHVHLTQRKEYFGKDTHVYFVLIPDIIYLYTSL